ncbi:hypothetical protein D3C72_874120 [compost metagenome]
MIGIFVERSFCTNGLMISRKELIMVHTIWKPIISRPIFFVSAPEFLKVRIEGNIIFPKGKIIKDKAVMLMSLALSRLQFSGASALGISIRSSGAMSKDFARFFRVNPLSGLPDSILCIVRKDTPDFSASSD